MSLTVRLEKSYLVFDTLNDGDDASKHGMEGEDDIVQLDRIHTLWMVHEIFALVKR